MSLKFRDAEEDDAEELAGIANEFVLRDSISIESMRDLIHDRRIIVAEETQSVEIVGYVNYEVHGTDVIVHHIAVVPDRRREGIGTDLIEYPIQFADSEGLRTRVIVEKEDDSTRSFLGSLGFEHGDTRFFDGRKMTVFERDPR
ncbi:MAG: GNAT family N-acetyltransferase [Halobacteria archaeon]|nr:GNAT family N-acetyltransferase [Halobacteria archaeon]